LAWISYVKYSAFIFIFIQLFSLYSSKKSLFYGPFLTATFGSILIFLYLAVFESLSILILGNIIMIGAAFWNSRSN